MTLREVRELLTLTQVELDRRAGLPKGTTNDLESGRNPNPSVKVCDGIVKALQRAGAKGVSIESLFCEQEVAS